MLKQIKNIRNLSIIGPQGSGKTTIFKLILTQLQNEGLNELEQKENLTVEQTYEFNIQTLVYKNKEDEDQTNITVIDTPGHFDLVGEVQSALRLSDGAIFVVDALFGVTLQAKILSKYLSREQIKPILLINKVKDKNNYEILIIRIYFEIKYSLTIFYKYQIDLLIQQLEGNQDKILSRLKMIIQEFNESISIFYQNGTFNQIIDPEQGNVIFASAQQNWGFTLNQISTIINSFAKEDLNKITIQLWNGQETNSQSESIEEKSILRKLSFNKQVIQPIIEYQHKVINKTDSNLEDLFIQSIKNLYLDSKNEEFLELKDQPRNNLQIRENIIGSIIKYLPSPFEAMQSRSIHIYQGSLNDEVGNSIRNNNHEGCLMAQVIKLDKINNKIFAVCRIFSGSLRLNQKTRILNPQFKIGGKDHQFKQNITDIKLPNKHRENVESAQAGQIVFVKFYQNFKVLRKFSTITSSNKVNPLYPTKQLPLLVNSVVSPVYNHGLNILVQALEFLSLSDSIANYISDENTGQHIIESSGYFHAEYIIKKLTQIIDEKCEFICKLKYPFYKESIIHQNNDLLLTKSPNKMNRLYGRCQQIDEQYAELFDFDANDICSWSDQEKINLLTNQFHWNKKDYDPMFWLFSPPSVDGSNVFVSKVKGVQLMDQSMVDKIQPAFRWVTKEGLLCDQPLRRMQFILEDAVLRASNRSTAGQIIPTVRRLLIACQYSNNPQLLEPMCITEIQSENHLLTEILQLLQQKELEIVDYSQDDYLSAIKINSFISEIPLIEDIVKPYSRINISNLFASWKNISGNALDPSTKAGRIVQDIRNFKGMNKIKDITEYIDKL